MGTLIMMMMMKMNCFCGMVDRQKVFSPIPAGTIVRDPHHRKSLTCREQDLTCAEPVSSGLVE